MRKKMYWNWEKLDDSTGRAQVIGGWIIHHISITSKGQQAESMVFVPDRDHEWTIIPKLEEVKVEKSKVSEGY